MTLLAGGLPQGNDAGGAIVAAWRAAWNPDDPSIEVLERALIAQVIADAIVDPPDAAARLGRTTDGGRFLPAGDRWAFWWRDERDETPLEAFRAPAHVQSRTVASTAVAQLPLAHRTAIVLVDVAGWQDSEVDALLGVAATDRLTLLHEARSHVRRALEQLAGIRPSDPMTDDVPSPRTPVADYDISCRDLTTLTTDYLAGALSPRSRVTFEEHLLICAPCRVHLGEVEIARHVLGTLPAVAMPTDVRDAVTALVTA
jgi:putative zinc finger protein